MIGNYTDSNTNLLFCEEEGENLHRVMTFNSDAKVRHCAEIVKDTFLLAKLAGSDMIALESKYHLNCLTNLYRSAAPVLTNRPDLENIVEKKNCQFDDSLAFAEIIDY